MNVRILPIVTPVSATLQARVEGSMKSIHTCRGASLALAMLAACAGLALDSRTAAAVQIFEEPFDNGLANWNITHSHFSTSGDMLRGNGDGARGAMFRPADGVNLVRFSFLRTENGDARNSGDSIEVGITEDQATTVFMSLGGAGPSVLFQSDARQPSAVGPDFGFYVYGDGTGNALNSWLIRDLVTDSVWYDGFIRLEDNGTATFGFRPSATMGSYTTSSGHALPAGLARNLVGVTAYRVPPAEGATGVGLLDNVSAHIVPEPSAAVLGVAALAAVSSVSRRIKRRQALSFAAGASVT